MTPLKTAFLIFSCFAFFSFAQAKKSKTTVIDAHCHIKTLDIPSEEMFKTMDEYFNENEKYDLRYVFALTVAQRGKPRQTKARNDSLINMSARNPRLVPICSVHPFDGEAAIAELDRLASRGVKMIKLHGHSQNFNHLNEQVIRLVKEAGKRDIAILFDGAGVFLSSYFDELLILAQNFPDTKMVLAHMGGGEFWKIPPIYGMKKLNPDMFENVWFDISATVGIYAGSPYMEQIKWSIRTVGVDRFLFGSDNPLVSLTQALEDFEKYGFKREEKEKILYKNAMQLLDLQEQPSDIK